jgi:hypothetical protein
LAWKEGLKQRQNISDKNQENISYGKERPNGRDIHVNYNYFQIL